MASSVKASTILFLSLNLVFIALVSSHNVDSCTTNPRNPVVIRPGDVLSNGRVEGLLDLEAAVCLCTAVRANVLGININLPISLNLFLNNCGRRIAIEYICNLM
ncbi:hypothetical protein like AT1G12100 [Hibiscus trionum]|uniref:Hydrophobic seed protein domain-containing protein n=1 Tax=Hibiscus trionum TaxID=183268 RepID=A0A9W7HR16_HIBTR|nr:hypothetical protein like AT1G12100 [Hibiscus trionum]